MRIFGFLVLSFWLLAAPALAAPTHGRAAALERKLRAIAADYAGRMRIGVAVIHIPSGEQVSVDGARAYPLGSVFKLPIMVELARQMQAGGGTTLQTRLTLREVDKCIGSGNLQYARVGTQVTVARLVELMETISDNTATDMIFNRIGVPGVNAMMWKLGLESADISLTNRAAYLISLGMGSDFRGLGARAIAKKWLGMSAAERQAAVSRILAENRGLTRAAFQQVENASAARQTGQAYTDDVFLAATVDNLASPNDIAGLLRALWQGEILDARWTGYCFDVLSRQQYNTRIPRMLPPAVRTYHKTGTIAGIVNDAGVIKISKDSAIALAVFVRDVQEGSRSTAETAIARMSRAAYDTYAGDH
ncbi:MAG: serine hydrolase [Armatimonadetes bacterium]|nr:serine hydrolase [Armatimonadota bacterium]